MKDESSGSCPDGTGYPRRSSRRIAGKFSYRSSLHIAGPYSCWTGGASSVRLSRGIVGCRSRRTRSLPGRLPASEPSRRTNSESRASSAFPARLMEPSTFDDSMDYTILTCLVTNKTLAKDHSSWDPTADEVQRAVLPLLQGFIDANKLKQRIDEFQMKVKNHLERNERIVANKELLLDVFDYVIPEFILSTYDETYDELTLRPFSPPRGNGKKRTSICSDEKDDSAIQHRSKRSSCSESVDHHLARLLDQRAAVQEILTGPISMKQCTDKLKKCGFSNQLLWHAIDILKADLELR